MEQSFLCIVLIISQKVVNDTPLPAEWSPDLQLDTEPAFYPSLPHRSCLPPPYHPVEPLAQTSSLLVLTLFLALLSWNWHRALCKLKVSSVVIGWYMCVWWEMFTIIRLVDTSFPSYNYHLDVMARTQKLSFLSNFRVCNTVSLTTVAIAVR